MPPVTSASSWEGEPWHIEDGVAEATTTRLSIGISDMRTDPGTGKFHPERSIIPPRERI
jgi:hypothetical protein